MTQSVSNQEFNFTSPVSPPPVTVPIADSGLLATHPATSQPSYLSSFPLELIKNWNSSVLGLSQVSSLSLSLFSPVLSHLAKTRIQPHRRLSFSSKKGKQQQYFRADSVCGYRQQYLHSNHHINVVSNTSAPKWHNRELGVWIASRTTSYRSPDYHSHD